jgi:ABC-type multidrug transport system fused ATPase/permease subunit
VVAEQGRHHELLDRGGLYAKLCRAQVQGFLGWDDAQEEKS